MSRKHTPSPGEASPASAPSDAQGDGDDRTGPLTDLPAEAGEQRADSVKGGGINRIVVTDGRINRVVATDG